MLRFNLPTTQDIDLNDLYIALLNYIYAKQKEEGYILRVDDLDNTKESLEQINSDIVKKFAIEFDQTLYKSQNKNIYNKFISTLIKQKNAYFCFCKEENSCKCNSLDSETINKYINNKKEYSIYMEYKSNRFKLANKDKTPTPLFSNIIDDMIQNIDTVIEDNKFSKFEEIRVYIQKTLGYKKQIKYIYTPSIKESKKIKVLFRDGFIPDAIINYLLSQNYSTPTKDILYLPDAIKFYNFDNIQNKNIIFDKEILKEFNKAHLEAMDNQKLSTIVGFADAQIGLMLKTLLEDSYTINELVDKFKAIFRKKSCEGKDKTELQKLSGIILKSPMIDSYDEFIEYILENSSFTKERLDILLKKLILSNISEIDISKIYPYIKPYLLEVARCQ